MITRMRIPSELIKQKLVKPYKSVKKSGDRVVFIGTKPDIEIAAINLLIDFIDVEKCIFIYASRKRALEILIKSYFGAFN